jgi:hypothetical protein
MSASRQEMRVLVYPVVSLIGDCKHHKKGEGKGRRGKSGGGGGCLKGFSQGVGQLTSSRTTSWKTSMGVLDPLGIR